MGKSVAGNRSEWLRTSLQVVVAAALVACGSVNAADDAGVLPDAAAECPVCDPLATCAGSTCVCADGYSGSGEVCDDIDECQTNNGGCDANADCTNVAGSRECDCRGGFVGNGMTCRFPWQMVTGAPGVDIDPEGFGTKAAGVGPLVLFGPDASGVGVPFMRAFDPATNNVSPNLMLPSSPQNDFCACGFTDAFVGAGGELYMLGNEGQRYSPGLDLWTTVNSYTDPHRRGEAAAAFDPTNQLLWLVGGREHETGIVTMTVPGQIFTSAAGQVPFEVNQGRAWVFSPDGRLYVAGGFGGSQRHLGFRDPESGAWTMLPDAPVSLAPTLGMGEFQGRLWVATAGGLSFYRPGSGQWEGSIVVPPGLEAVVTAGPDTYALCKGAGGLEIHRLVAIE